MLRNLRLWVALQLWGRLFSTRMKEAYDAVILADGTSLPSVTTHGLRYTTVAVLSELGCNDKVIASITGHQTFAMIRKYQGKEREAELATTAMNDAHAQRKALTVSPKVQDRI